MNIKAQIQAGVCGLNTTVEATSPDGMNVLLHIHSDCPQVQAMAAELTELDAFQQVLQTPLIETTPAQLAQTYKLHTTCPVPIALLKAVEAAAGLALPANCEIELVRIEEGDWPLS